MSTFRLMTAGSVDDGKSTLIGRLLVETDSVPLDQIEAVSNARGRAALVEYRGKKIDLSLLTDGLIDERAQGITIDVAYRYFHHAGHSFILADAPGHIQYTRNMITAASHSDIAIILIDPTRLETDDELLIQTKRHTLIAHALGLKLIGVINKMDAINWSRSVFESIKQRYESFLENIGAEAVSIIPCSALLGDSIVQRSAHMPWYQGPTLIESLELPENDRLKPVDPFLYLTIQNTLRDPKKLTRRLYGVRVGGNHAVLKVGDEFESYPGKEMVRVLGLYVGEKSIHEAQPGQAVSVELDRDIGLTHGDWLLPPYETAYSLQNQLEVSVCWMNSKPMQAGKSVGLSGKYLAKIGSRTVWVKVGTTPSVFDWEQLDWQEKADVQLNDLARITLNFSESIPVRFFSKKGDKGLSSAILIDPTTYETVAAVWFDQPLNKLNKNVVSFEHLNRAASSPRLKE